MLWTDLWVTAPNLWTEALSCGHEPCGCAVSHLVELAHPHAAQARLAPELARRAGASEEGSRAVTGELRDPALDDIDVTGTRLRRQRRRPGFH